MENSFSNVPVQIYAPARKLSAASAVRRKNYPKAPPVISFSSDEWNKAAPPPLAPEPQLLEREPVAEEVPLECRGLPTWKGQASLIDALVAHGLPGLKVRDIRGLAPVCKVLERDMADDEVWRLMCAALATEHGLYAPASSFNWQRLFLDTLWPARSKWRGADAAEAHGFRIRVAVRVRPRKHDGSLSGLVLPLHQRLKLLKKGERLGSLSDELAGSSHEQLSAALKEQGELPPELLQALLEAQQLGAVVGQAEAQARGGPKHDASHDVEEGSGAAHAAAAAADAASDATPLTRADHEYLARAEKAAGKAEVADGEKAKEAADEAEEDGAAKGASAAKLLLVQPSRVVMFVPGSGVRPFLFSTVCDGQAAQLEVYQRVAQDAVCSALNGMNACVLAYGQTGSGKTHTVFGPPGTIDAACTAVEAAATRDARMPSTHGLALSSALPPSAGLVLRACEELLNCARSPQHACTSLSLSAQYVQIYDESLTDLLSGGAVMLRELGEYATDGMAHGGAVLQGAAHVQLQTVTDALALLRAGELHKRVAATAMNDTSSRAHTVFLLSLTQRGGAADDDETQLITSQLALVDLAGCEQVKQSKVVGTRLREAVGINSSLLVLGKCITALSEGRRHVPYQESKLTRLLRGAFGGSSRTTCVIAASPDDAHADNTVQALRFGERCATITNAAKVGAVSAKQALAVVDEALAACEKSMGALEAKGRTNLPAYASLKARHASLKVRRHALSAA